MRRLIALLASVTAVFVMAAVPVAADPVAPAAGSSTTAVPPGSIPQDALGLSPAQIAGSGLAVTLDPGASEEHDLVVSNHTADLRLTVKIDATDATGNLDGSSASWLAFGDDVIELDPHVATTVPMTIAVPHDTQPGSALAHVRATVESAVSASDGSPVAGTATVVFPVSIAVSGTPTAQIAIADVHRVDQGSTHQLAVVLRNFGAQGAQVAGHVVVSGDSPQTVPFQAQLAASRDTTLDLNWKAPPQGAATDIAVDLEYGAGNVASWSSELGGAATDLSPTSVATSTPTSAAVTTAGASAGAAPSKPFWNQSSVTLLVILAIMAAGAWLGFEMLASRRRDRAPLPAQFAMHSGFVPNPSEESIDLAKQIVRLTDVVVQLVESHRSGMGFALDVAAERPRARSPDLPREGSDARAGPEPLIEAMAPTDRELVSDPGSPPDRALPLASVTEIIRPASPTPGASPRSEPEPEPEPESVPEPVDPQAATMERLVALDRERRKLRGWMDAEDSGLAVEPNVVAPDPGSDGQRAGLMPDDRP